MNVLAESVVIFTMLFVVADPIGNTPVFFALTRRDSPAARRRTALRAVFSAFAILVFFAVAGNAFLSLVGITLPAFRIAGGMLLFVAAMQMIFTGDETANSPMGETRAGKSDVAVFPLAIPLIAGPGTIACVILLTSQHPGDFAYDALVLANLAAVLAVTLAMFLSAGRILKACGNLFSEITTKILGVVLAALSVQFVIDGVREAFGL